MVWQQQHVKQTVKRFSTKCSVFRGKWTKPNNSVGIGQIILSHYYQVFRGTINKQFAYDPYTVALVEKHGFDSLDTCDDTVRAWEKQCTNWYSNRDPFSNVKYFTFLRCPMIFPVCFAHTIDLLFTPPTCSLIYRFLHFASQRLAFNLKPLHTKYTEYVCQAYDRSLSPYTFALC